MEDFFVIVSKWRLYLESQEIVSRNINDIVHLMPIVHRLKKLSINGQKQVNFIRCIFYYPKSIKENPLKLYVECRLEKTYVLTL